MIVAADEHGLAAAVAALRNGDVVVLPTDTVYGVAVSAFVEGATGKLFAAKQRPKGVELPVLVGSPSNVDALVEDVPPVARLLMERYWPGALTLVFDRRPGLGFDLGGDPSSIGLRCPGHPVAQELARRVGPLATTSANLHGQPTPATATGVAEALGDSVTLVLDGGMCEGAPSTVVSVRAGELTLLRQGRIPWADITAFGS